VSPAKSYPSSAYPVALLPRPNRPDADVRRGGSTTTASSPAHPARDPERHLYCCDRADAENQRVGVRRRMHLLLIIACLFSGADLSPSARGPAWQHFKSAQRCRRCRQMAAQTAAEPLRGRTATSMLFLSAMKRRAGRQNLGNDGSGLGSWSVPWWGASSVETSTINRPRGGSAFPYSTAVASFARPAGFSTKVPRGSNVVHVGSRAGSVNAAGDKAGVIAGPGSKPQYNRCNRKPGL
jgi:hypothetical protein